MFFLFRSQRFLIALAHSLPKHSLPIAQVFPPLRGAGVEFRVSHFAAPFFYAVVPAFLTLSFSLFLAHLAVHGQRKTILVSFFLSIVWS
jgi:histone H3/H4